MNGNGTDFNPSIQHKEYNTIKLLNIFFPEFINDKYHITRMRRKINKQLKECPIIIRLQKINNIYNKINKLARMKKQ